MKMVEEYLPTCEAGQQQNKKPIPQAFRRVTCYIAKTTTVKGELMEGSHPNQ
jgi:hypothetical protein